METQPLKQPRHAFLLRWLLPVFVAGVAAQVVSAAADQTNGSTVPEHRLDELHVNGRQLETHDGRQVWLQGVNVVSLEFKLEGEHVTDSIVEAVDHWKANVIRLPIKESYWFGREKGQNDGGRTYRERVDAAIRLAHAHGAYVVLDLHRFGAVRPEHIEFWHEAANHYKNDPGILFDLFNEPHSTSWEVWRNGGWVSDRKTDADEDSFLPAADQAKAKQGFESPGMQKLVDTVRATGARNIIVAGGLDWAYDLSGIVAGYALTDSTGNGIMYSTHIYNWKRDWAGKVMPAVERYPILVGEVGADVKKMPFLPADIQEDPYTWVPDMLGLIQKHRLNWTAWSFHPRTTPVLLVDWTFKPTPFWGEFAKQALAGRPFELKKMR